MSTPSRRTHHYTVNTSHHCLARPALQSFRTISGSWHSATKPIVVTTIMMDPLNTGKPFTFRGLLGSHLYIIRISLAPISCGFIILFCIIYIWCCLASNCLYISSHSFVSCLRAWHCVLISWTTPCLYCFDVSKSCLESSFVLYCTSSCCSSTPLNLVKLPGILMSFYCQQATQINADETIVV